MHMQPSTMKSATSFTIVIAISLAIFSASKISDKINATKRESALAWLVASANAKVAEFSHVHGRNPESLTELSWSELEDGATIDLLKEVEYDQTKGTCIRKK